MPPKSLVLVTPTRIQRVVLTVLSRTPLIILHGLGWLLGLISFFVRGHSRRRSLGVARDAGIHHAYWNVLLSYADFGRAMLEGPWIWMNPPEKTLRRFKINISEKVQKELSDGAHPILFLGLHLGCSEAGLAYLSYHYRVSVLYQTQKNRWLLALRAMQHPHHHTDLVAMNTSGIRYLIRQVQGQTMDESPMNKGRIVISADQTPPEGSGDWLSFLGQSAYTMRLAPKISLWQDTRTYLCVHLRRWGGFSMTITAMENLPTEPLKRAEAFNDAFSNIIYAHPHQYRWSYDRFRKRGRKTPSNGKFD